MSNQQFDVLDTKGFVGRITYRFTDTAIADPNIPWAKEGEFTMLVARSSRNGLGYLTEKAFMKNLKQRIGSFGGTAEVLKVERLVTANVAMESTVLTPDDLK